MGAGNGPHFCEVAVARKSYAVASLEGFDETKPEKSDREYAREMYGLWFTELVRRESVGDYQDRILFAHNCVNCWAKKAGLTGL